MLGEVNLTYRRLYMQEHDQSASQLGGVAP